MRLRVMLLVALAACSVKPYDTFDTGYDVHFVLYVEGAALKVEPVCTVGPAVRRSRVEQLAPAAEVAVINGTKSGARTTHVVDQDLWVLFRVVPGEPQAKLKVFNKPPADRIPQGWPSLVDVPR
jgi:hypothetical protein